MSFAKALRCRECGREYPLTASHVCEFCFGPLEVVYDYEAMSKTIYAREHRGGPALRVALQGPAARAKASRSTSTPASRR